MIGRGTYFFLKMVYSSFELEIQMAKYFLFELKVLKRFQVVSNTNRDNCGCAKIKFIIKIAYVLLYTLMVLSFEMILL